MPLVLDIQLGFAMSSAGIGLLVAAALLLVVGLWLISVYNRLTRLRVRCQNAYSQIDVQLKRRFDLIPNLVETVKGYMAHERQTLEAVIAARSAAVRGLSAAGGPHLGGAAGMGALALASGQLDVALGRLFGVMERYPELKASQNALALQEELVHTENRVAFARQGYNDGVMAFNSELLVFPNNIVGGLLLFHSLPLFEAAAGEREAVRVSMGAESAP